MKKILIVLLVYMHLLAGCAVEPAPTEPTDSIQNMEVQPTATVPTERQTDWSQYSDYELMEMTLKSETNAYKYLSPVYMFDREWLLFMMEHCEPFKELMFRETALESMKEHTLELLHQYQDKRAGMLSQNFAELVVTLLPEMEEELFEFVGSTVTVREIPIN